jgi:uncharacterized protein YndB with AHSA1/START domain
MTDNSGELRSVIVERELGHPAEKVWRALTQPHLIGEWLMKSDFKPVVDHAFQFNEEWGSIDCKVLTVEEQRVLSYTWSAFGLDSVVTWTLTPTAAGTLLRMEQAGFPADQEQSYRGATAAWPEYFSQMEAVLAKM